MLQKLINVLSFEHPKLTTFWHHTILIDHVIISNNLNVNNNNIISKTNVQNSLLTCLHMRAKINWRSTISSMKKIIVIVFLENIYYFYFWIIYVNHAIFKIFRMSSITSKSIYVFSFPLLGSICIVSCLQ